MDLSATIVPKSDQLNAEDLLTGPRTFTVAEVRKGSAEQPVDIHLVEHPGRPFKPSKTVRRILVAAWGAEAANYTGRRMTLYRDPKVKWAGQEVGGIRVSHLSHIKEPLRLALAATKSARETYIVKPLADDAPAAAPVPNYMEDARAAKTRDEFRKVWKRAHDAGHLTDALAAELTPIGKALPDEPAEEEPPADFQGELYNPGGE